MPHMRQDDTINVFYCIALYCSVVYICVIKCHLNKNSLSLFFLQKNCSDEGGYLVSIESEQENKFLTNTLKQLWTGQCKFGLSLKNYV